jgi:hypothetical protein
MVQVSSKLDRIAYFFAPLLLEGHNDIGGLTLERPAPHHFDVWLTPELHEDLVHLVPPLLTFRRHWLIFELSISL